MRQALNLSKSKRSSTWRAAREARNMPSFVIATAPLAVMMVSLVATNLPRSTRNTGPP